MGERETLGFRSRFQFSRDETYPTRSDWMGNTMRNGERGSKAPLLIAMGTPDIYLSKGPNILSGFPVI